MSFVALTATNNGRLYGLHGRKGTIAVGADAEIAVRNPGRKRVLRSTDPQQYVDYIPYEGRTITGWPEMVLSGGDIIVSDGLLNAEPGHGRFLEQAPSSALRRHGRVPQWT